VADTLVENILEGKNVKHLKTPLTDEDISALHAGDFITISGTIFTGRAKWFHRVVKEGKSLPIDVVGKGYNVLMPAGLTVKKESDQKWRIVAMIPFPASLLDADDLFTVVKNYQIKAVLGAGRIENSAKRCKENKCIYCVRVGHWYDYSSFVREVSVEWLDLGLVDAMWIFKAENMGPFMVETDIHGRSLYEERWKEIDKTMLEAYKRLGLNASSSE
jgi:tartrate dehydratase beta subunit/fumarate hydratase class I family protein